MDPQPFVRTMPQNVTKYFRMLLSKYISNALYSTDLSYCSKLTPWSLKILANMVTLQNKMMEAGNNVPSWAGCRTGPKVTEILV